MTSPVSASDTDCGRGPGMFSLRPLPATTPRRTQSIGQPWIS
uniref:Uncharacterized protein n=1 Tax=Siphoviridae sp. ctnR15 TaxID=2827938 RepID=A0A8S5T1M3_9CAUD|nr:MAG TPA: hypothetical protein [Siphoviridae sp. ctnR15]DAY37768.1 MAG TPA: hypothetical protein [Caudoviricetes sp.]